MVNERGNGFERYAGQTSPGGFCQAFGIPAALSVLLNIGFGKIHVDADVSEKVYSEVSKIRYRTVAPFMIRAEKTNDRYLYGFA
jgi:hypothetical protein